MRNLIIGSIIVMVMVSLVGCAIYVVPLNDGRVPLPPAAYGMEFNTYGSGWGWPFLRSPGIGWGQRGYYYPGHLKSVPGPNGIGRYIWIPNYYE